MICRDAWNQRDLIGGYIYCNCLIRRKKLPPRSNNFPLVWITIVVCICMWIQPIFPHNETLSLLIVPPFWPEWIKRDSRGPTLYRIIRMMMNTSTEATIIPPMMMIIVPPRNCDCMKWHLMYSDSVVNCTQPTTRVAVREVMTSS